MFAFFPTDSEVSAKEAYLISLIKTSGKEKNYELIEYISDVNRTHAEVLVEQNCNGAMDTAYVYGTDRLSLDRFDGSTGYYLYDPKGSVTGITNGEGQICLSYRYGSFGEITYGAPQYENIYAYNGESYNPNVGSLYLRARYYNVAAGAFFTEDSYLGNLREPLTLNRYVYCVGNPVNYVDPSGKSVENDIMYAVLHDNTIPPSEKGYEIGQRIQFYYALVMLSDRNVTTDFVLSYDYNGDRNFLNETLAKADEYRWNIRMGMGLAEELGINVNCYSTGEDFKTDNKYYNRNVVTVSQITGTDVNFSEEIEHFKELYILYKERYEQLSERTGVPPELIASIHYHENASDFDWENEIIYFSVYLHNGQKLGSKTTIAPTGILFGEEEFDKAVIDALEAKPWSQVEGTNEEFKSNNMAAYMATGLKDGNDSLIAMLIFAEYYNGRTSQISTYLYNGALNATGENIPGDGKYVSDVVYDLNAINKQPGIYLLLNSIIETY